MKMAEYCKSGDHLHDALRDRFVCSVQHETIQLCLLSQDAVFIISDTTCKAMFPALKIYKLNLLKSYTEEQIPLFGISMCT